jgi:hypothetical protein
MEVVGPPLDVGTQQLMNTINTSTASPIITQTTTNKIQTSRKIQVPTANNTTTEIEETVVQYENVTVSTITQQNLQRRNDGDTNTRSPTESEIIEGYTVPFASQEPKQEITTFNPPGSYGPFPPVSYTPTPPSPNMSYAMTSYSSTPPSPVMNPQGGYVSAQRKSLDQQNPTSIQSNLPEFFNKQQQLFNNLPPQIPMTIRFELPAQQLY